MKTPKKFKKKKKIITNKKEKKLPKLTKVSKQFHKRFPIQCPMLILW